MDGINWTEDDHKIFVRATTPPEGTKFHPSVDCSANWYLPEENTTLWEEHRQLLRDLADDKPRAHAYLAQIVAWRMNRGT